MPDASSVDARVVFAGARDVAGVARRRATVVRDDCVIDLSLEETSRQTWWDRFARYSRSYDGKGSAGKVVGDPPT